MCTRLQCMYYISSPEECHLSHLHVYNALNVRIYMEIMYICALEIKLLMFPCSEDIPCFLPVLDTYRGMYHVCMHVWRPFACHGLICVLF